MFGNKLQQAAQGQGAMPPQGGGSVLQQLLPIIQQIVAQEVQKQMQAFMQQGQQGGGM